MLWKRAKSPELNFDSLEKTMVFLSERLAEHPQVLEYHPDIVASHVVDYFNVLKAIWENGELFELSPLIVEGELVGNHVTIPEDCLEKALERVLEYEIPSPDHMDLDL